MPAVFTLPTPDQTQPFVEQYENLSNQLINTKQHIQNRENDRRRTINQYLAFRQLRTHASLLISHPTLFKATLAIDTLQEEYAPGLESAATALDPLNPLTDNHLTTMLDTYKRSLKRYIVNFRNDLYEIRRENQAHNNRLPSLRRDLERAQQKLRLAQSTASNEEPRTIDPEQVARELSNLPEVRRAYAQVEAFELDTPTISVVLDLFPITMTDSAGRHSAAITLTDLSLGITLYASNNKLYPIFELFGPLYIGYDRAETTHPHWLNVDDPCLGDFGPPITELVHQGDLVGVAELLIKHISQYNSEDPAGETFENWMSGATYLDDEGDDVYCDLEQDHEPPNWANSYRHNDSETPPFVYVQGVCELRPEEEVTPTRVNTTVQDAHDLVNGQTDQRPAPTEELTLTQKNFLRSCITRSNNELCTRVCSDMDLEPGTIVINEHYADQVAIVLGPDPDADERITALSVKDINDEDGLVASLVFPVKTSLYVLPDTPNYFHAFRVPGTLPANLSENWDFSGRLNAMPLNNVYVVPVPAMPRDHIQAGDVFQLVNRDGQPVYVILDYNDGSDLPYFITYRDGSWRQVCEHLHPDNIAQVFDSATGLPLNVFRQNNPFEAAEHLAA